MKATAQNSKPFQNCRQIFCMIIIIFFGHPTFVYAQNVSQPFEDCKGTFNCGNITEIGYPFWGSNRQDYCGHPEFQLNCADQTAKIKIDEFSYQVLSIDSDSKNLKVVRENHIGDLCPEPHVNITLDRTVLNLASDIRNISIYYGCEETSSLIPTSQYTTFSCNDTTNNTTGFFTTREISNTSLANYSNSCHTKVLVQAAELAIAELETSLRFWSVDDLLGALDQGFGLQWNVNNSICETCILSDGVCGYNSTFTCYCSDGQQDLFSCGGTTTTNNQIQPESGMSSSPF
ncbi:Protein kinase superfamily protein [Euphorbia peplus]|nr:Protein kinase superfamily protein [Euphorbia peplus]